MMNAPRILLLHAAGLAAPLMTMARDAVGCSVPAAKIRTKPVAKLARSFLPLLLTIAGLIAIAGTAWAQDAGSLLREQERARELEQLEKKLPRAEEAPEKAPAAKPETGETILIKEIRYTGKIELFTEAERAGFAAARRGGQVLQSCKMLDCKT